MAILVTGASGTLGQATLPALVAAGQDVRAISRKERITADPVTWLRADLTTDRDLPAALDGVDTVLHLASAPFRRGYTKEVDLGGTQRLVSASRRAGVAHLIYVSIVGVDQVPLSYYRVKLAAEQIVQAAPGWTILRATQFPQLLDSLIGALAKLPVLPVDPGFLAQPVTPHDVAGRIVELVDDGPVQRVLEFGGPEVINAYDAARQWLAASGRNKRVVRARLPGRYGASVRAGHLTTSTTPTGTSTWSAYLAERFASRPGSEA